MTETITFHTVGEILAILRIGRSTFYYLVSQKKLKTVKLSGKTLVRKDHLDEFISSLEH